MILKQPGNHKIHRLRVIHLYEHDYNLLLAVKWCSLIHHCVHTKKFNPGQYGGLPGHDAITLTIFEEFQYEISRACKCPLVHLDYNATAFYDRIILPMASLISRFLAFKANKNLKFCTMVYRMATPNGIDCCYNQTLGYCIATTHFDWMGLKCCI